MWIGGEIQLLSMVGVEDEELKNVTALDKEQRRYETTPRTVTG
jgi:hypothetical protein